MTRGAVLNFIDFPSTAAGSDLLIVHGLYGSARNWRAMGKRLSDRGRVVAVDQRNHGDSPWFDSHTYDDMAADLAEVIETTMRAPVDVLGHSMGGKAAMVLALSRPDLVNRLVVADIAPVTYGHDPSDHIRAMRAVDLATVRRRSDVETQLRAQGVASGMLRAFFAQSFDVKAGKWLLNLDVLDREMPEILGFPDMPGGFPGKVLFLSGAESNYVRPEHRAGIKELFPKAQFARIPGADHWLHADKPAEFEAALRVWLDA